MLKLQKCNSCKTVFENKTWIDTCPVCKSKNIDHNEDGHLFEWHNYGDLNFLEHGGCLVKEDEYKDCFHVLMLTTYLPDYRGRLKYPMVVAKCFVDLSNYLKPDDEGRKEVNKFYNFDEDYIPQSLDEKMLFCVDLINHYGFHEFDPEFPEETGCGPYGFTWDKIIVGKTIAQKFMKECGIPYKYRH